VKHKVRHIHFVGIGGAGMSGIAEVLANLGYEVSGSDLAGNAATRRLQGLGAKVKLAHAPENVNGADAIVISSAVRADNPEVIAARAKRIPVVPRALMLAELMRLKRGVAIAGTHGKTTTTSLVASVLAEGGLDPTFVIGGRLNAAGSNARLGAGEFIVVEADESDASFLHLQPVIAVVTNIDADHMETYQHDFARLKQAFVSFLQNLPFYGSAVLCLDDPQVREILPFVSKPVLSYGLAPEAMVRAENLVHAAGAMRFTALRAGLKERRAPLAVTLNLPGVHNVQNALAAIAVASELGVPDEVVALSKNEDFIGREALIRRTEHPHRKLVGLEMEGDEAVGHGDCVHVGRAQIGVVTSATRSPILGKTIALARIDVAYDRLGSEVEVGKLDGQQKRLPARIVRFPHYDPKKTRVRA